MAKLVLIPLQQTSLTLLPDLKGSCPFPIIKWSGMTSTGIIAKSVPRSQVTLNACSLRVIFYLVHTAHSWPTHNLRPFHVCFEETILYVLLYYALKNQSLVIYMQEYCCFQKIHRIPITNVKGSSMFSSCCEGDEKTDFPCVKFLYVVFRWKKITEQLSLEIQTAILLVVMIIITTFAAVLLSQTWDLIKES